MEWPAFAPNAPQSFAPAAAVTGVDCNDGGSHNDQGPLLLRQRTEPPARSDRQLRIQSLVRPVGVGVGDVGVRLARVRLPAEEVTPVLRQLTDAGFLEWAQLLRTRANPLTPD